MTNSTALKRSLVSSTKKLDLYQQRMRRDKDDDRLTKGVKRVVEERVYDEIYHATDGSLARERNLGRSAQGRT